LLFSIPPEPSEQLGGKDQRGGREQFKAAKIQKCRKRIANVCENLSPPVNIDNVGQCRFPQKNSLDDFPVSGQQGGYPARYQQEKKQQDTIIVE
jgi:hypothetical protein